MAEARAVLPLFAPNVPAAAAALEDVGDRSYHEVMRHVAEILGEHSGHSYIKPDLVAEFYACAGDKRKALDWLEAAYTDRRIEMVYLGVLPSWDVLRAEPRSRDLLARMNLPTLEFRPVHAPPASGIARSPA